MSPDWSKPFKLMCDASDYAVEVVLGQRHDKVFQSIYYASRTLNEAQLNYTTTFVSISLLHFLTLLFIIFINFLSHTTLVFFKRERNGRRSGFNLVESTQAKRMYLKTRI
jgi:hypothetical protein